MNNWWIAALENAGIWTREQAEHVSNSIRNEIHRDKYTDTLATLDAVLDQGKFTDLPLIPKLETEIAGLKAELEQLKSTLAPVDEKSTTKDLTAAKA